MGADMLAVMIRAKLSEAKTSYARCDAILQHEGRNDLVHLILERASRNMTEARKAYFSRPTICLPFKLKTKTLRQALLRDASFREITFKSERHVVDELFQFRKHMFVHNALRDLISEYEPTSIKDESRLTQIIVDGINPFEFAVTQRTIMPVHTYFSNEFNVRQLHIYLVNLYDATRSISEWCFQANNENTLLKYVISPYERDMWHFDAGYSKDGGYIFSWLSDTDTNVSRLLSPESPRMLNERFFSSVRFASYVLRIQPYGSDKVLTFTRAEFLMLFSSAYSHDSASYFVNQSNGFVIVDLSMTTPPIPIRINEFCYTDHKMTNKGFMHIMPAIVTDLERHKYSMLRYTCNTSGYYVDHKLYDIIMQLATTITVNKAYMTNLITYFILLAKTPNFDFDRVKFMTIFSPEIISHVIEKILLAVIPIRLTIMDYSVRNKLRKASTSDKITRLSILVVSRMINSFISNHEKEILNINNSINESLVRYQRSPQITFNVNYGVDRDVTQNRIAYMATISEQIEALFDTAPEYRMGLTRTPVVGYDNKIFYSSIRQSLVLNKKYEVSISTLQALYDDLFPGNSVIDYTAMHSQAELANKSIVLAVPSFRVSYANIFSDTHERLLIKSKLRTSTSSDLTGSFMDMMGALMKRNFNRQAAEMSGNRREHVKAAISIVLSIYGVPAWRELLAIFASLPINPGTETLKLWSDKHTESDVKAAASIMKNKVADPAMYNAMPKAQTKPILDLSAQASIAVGQTVVFHSKDVIAISVGIFTLVLDRLLLLFPDSVRFAFGADEHTVGEWADKYLDIENTIVYEFDVPKFDKSQDQMCFTLILEVLKLVGVSNEFVDYWERASYQATVFNTCFAMVFNLFYGNRSGSGGTLAINCISLFFAFYTEFNNLGIVATLIKGDDSVMVTRKPITEGHIQRLLQRWGFTLKRREIRKYVTFCSGIFVKDSNDKYKLLRDPIRLLTKLGRSLSPERESAYFIDYYISFVDATSQYSDEVALANLKYAVTSVYDKTIDVDTIIQFLRKIVVSYKTFLKELYGFDDVSLKLIAKLDSINEIIAFARKQGFIKSNMLKDICPNLKIPLIEKIRSYTMEVTSDITIRREDLSSDSNRDIIDKMDWIHSI